MFCSRILVLVFLVAQLQSSWGISLEKRVSQTNNLNNFQVKNIEKSFENLPATNLLEDSQSKTAVLEMIKAPHGKPPRKAPLRKAPLKIPKTAPSKRLPRKKSRQDTDNPFIRGGSCNDEHVLDYGEATVIFSDDGNAARRCRSSFISPEGTTIRLECPLFDLAGNGCKKERLLVNEKGRKKVDFCKTETPNSYESTNNNMALVYARQERKMGEIKSPGFICKVMAIGERPTSPTTTTTTTTSPTTTSTTTTITTRKYTWPSPTPTTPTTTTRTTTNPRPTFGNFSTWWPPGTYWTDQSWSDGENEGWWSWNPWFTSTTTPPSPNNGTTWIAVTVTTE